VQDHVERELKYDVPDGWRVPDPAQLAPAGAAVQVETVHLHSVYFDTPVRDLLRHGVTLRRRTGDHDTGWQLKVPRGDARTEVRLPVDGSSIPTELSSLVRALRGSEPLRLVASVDTVRTIHRLVAASGEMLAEIADDSVTATATGEVAVVQQWREVEVELGEGDEQLLRLCAGWLADSGAVPSRSGSKLGRAVGAVRAPDRLPSDSLAALVAGHLHEQHLAIVRGDIDLRRGEDAVHRTRVATRRFRSALRIFADLFEPDARRHLDAELAWYAGELGVARDLQVMRKRLLAAAGELPEEVRERVAGYLTDRLDTDETAAREQLLTTLAGDRYAALLADVRALVEHPPAGVDRPAGKVRRYVRRAERKAAKRLAAASTQQSDERAHRARKAAKRARYTAELATPVLGSEADEVAQRHEDIQDELGELQDAIVAARYLERISRAAGGSAGFGIGLLWRAQQDHAEQIRARVPDLAGRGGG
jgi:CHAD domain-containing protein